MAKKALIIVDVQNDFCPGGALAVPSGDEVVEPLNKIIAYSRLHPWVVVASRDWHPAETKHFKNFGGLWPAHCVQNTLGAEFHPDLDYGCCTTEILKGTEPDDDGGYSAFSGTNLGGSTLEKILNDHGVRQVFIGGLATDYCVKATALDAVKFGFETYLLLDACRAVNINPDDEAKALGEMILARVKMATTKEVLDGVI